jgi:carbon monoxide dehydrogenase subunit G
MQLEHRFTVPAPVEDVWPVLLDVERVAPCMPGAALDSVRDGEYAGRLKVKVGPIQLTYSGTGRFTETDEAAHRAVLTGSGRETRGSGTAHATVTMILHDAGHTTDVTVLTNLAVTGRPTQFGRGVMADVGEKLIGRFAECLARLFTPEEPGVTGTQPASAAELQTATASAEPVSAGQAAAAPALPVRAAPPVDRTRPAVTTPSSRSDAEQEPIDLLEVAGLPVLKRLTPVLAVLAALFVAWAVFRRRRG